MSPQRSAAKSRGPGRPWEFSLRAARPRRGSLLSPLTLIGGFALLILAGAALLLAPQSVAAGRSTTYLDALFTSTSAVCVTGLVVVDTGTHWSAFGQVVVLTLIQIGGFGFMASTTLLLLAFGRRIGLHERLLVGESIGVSVPGGVVALVRKMAIVTLTAESVGALLLFPRFAGTEGASRGLWMAVFQSVSAFNNAGFDIFGDFVSLTLLRSDPVVVTVTALLLIAGGLSYVVLADVWRKGRFVRLSLDTKLVLTTSGLLLLVGTCAFLLFETTNDQTLGPLPWWQKLLCAAFQAATPRTAGFTTVDVGTMRDYTLLVTMLLMFVGGSAGSTAGGIKVNTFGLLAATVIGTLRGRSYASAFGREFSMQQVHRALAVTFLALSLVSGAILLLTLTEEADTLSVAFEAVSAFGTVGLSTGITPGLSTAGRLVVVATMFTGRLGPLFIGLALIQRQRTPEYRYPGEPVRIG